MPNTKAMMADTASAILAISVIVSEVISLLDFRELKNLDYRSQIEVSAVLKVACNSVYSPITYSIMALGSRYSSNPKTPPSLPIPDCLNPPKGANGSWFKVFIKTLPAFICEATLLALS